jgi:hypothetical protein
MQQPCLLAGVREPEHNWLSERDFVQGGEREAIDYIVWKVSEMRNVNLKFEI